MRARRWRVIATSLAGAMLGAHVVSAYAQAPGDGMPRATEPLLPAWMTDWSPLVPIADHPRELPRAPGAPGLLLDATPRIGLFWSAGNPAGLGSEVDRRWNGLGLQGALDRGSYRRPLDPGDALSVGFLGLGWQPLGRGAAAAGRVLVDQENLRRAPFADLIESYGSDPNVLADSSFPKMRRVRARFEGAFGWASRGWGLGISAGMEVRDHRSQEARFPRLGRRSVGAVTLGAARRLPVGRVRVGVHGGWQGSAETVNLLSQPALGTAYRVLGYAEPIRAEVGPPTNLLFRRVRRDAWTAGVEAAGNVRFARWVLGWNTVHRRNRHFSALEAHPPQDRWVADGWVLRAALQHVAPDEPIGVTARLNYSRLDGDASRADLPGTVFRESETVFTADLELRYSPETTPWMAGLSVVALREIRSAHDFVAEVRSHIRSWMPGAALELARAFGSGTRVSVAYSAVARSASASIPNPARIGPLYRLLIGPTLSFEATEARPYRLELGVSERLGAGARILLRGVRESVGPRAVEPGLPLPPSGNRTLWAVTATVILQ